MHAFLVMQRSRVHSVMVCDITQDCVQFPYSKHCDHGVIIALLVFSYYFVPSSLVPVITPHVGIEPTTIRLKAWRSND